MITLMCSAVIAMIVGFCIVYFALIFKESKEPQECHLCGGPLIEHSKKLRCEFCGEEYE